MKNGYGYSNKCLLISAKKDNNDEIDGNIFGINDHCHIAQVDSNSSNIRFHSKLNKRKKEPMISGIGWIQIATTMEKKNSIQNRIEYWNFK